RPLAGARAVHDGPHPAVRGGGRRRVAGQAPRRLPEARARLPRPSARVPDGDPARRERRPAHPPPARPGRPPASRARAPRRRAGVPLTPRRPGALGGVPRTAVRNLAGRAGDGHRRLRARGIDHRALRRQLELARAGLGPGQLPAYRCAPARPPASGRPVHGRVPAGLRSAAQPARGVARPRAAPRRDLPPRRRGTPAGVRRHGALPDRPRLARLAVLPRVLPRRRRQGPGGVAPDRMDRAGGGPRRAPLQDAGGGLVSAAAVPAARAAAAPVSSPAALGARPDGSGTAFAVFSSVAEDVDRCLFDETGGEHRLALRAAEGYRWEGRVEGVGPGTRYGYRVHGPWDPAAGARCNPAKLLLDPYARAVAGGVRWHQAVHGAAAGD